ncbi:phage integrase family protein [Ochrobactrum sp. CDB2]|nr:phage integrase family protein [Ochrobactrum sp. CDB2]
MWLSTVAVCTSLNLQSSVHAETWVNNGTYLWGEATNWQEGTVPNAPGAVATFIGNNWQGYYSYLNGQQFTVGELNISGSENGGFLFQHGTLVLSDPDGSAAIHVSTSNPYTDFGEYYPTTVELASTTVIDTSDADVETLRHLVNEGMDHNTVRAPSSDLAYREAWPMAETGSPCPTRRPVAEIR